MSLQCGDTSVKVDRRMLESHKPGHEGEGQTCGVHFTQGLDGRDVLLNDVACSSTCTTQCICCSPHQHQVDSTGFS